RAHKGEIVAPVHLLESPSWELGAQAACSKQSCDKPAGGPTALPSSEHFESGKGTRARKRHFPLAVTDVREYGLECQGFLPLTQSSSRGSGWVNPVPIFDWSSRVAPIENQKSAIARPIRYREMVLTLISGSRTHPLIEYLRRKRQSSLETYRAQPQS